VGASVRLLAFGGRPFHPPPNSHKHVDQVVNALTIFNHGIAARELAIQCGFLPQFWTYAAASRCRAVCETELTQLAELASIRPARPAILESCCSF
jgi:hypothetical protein